MSDNKPVLSWPDGSGWLVLSGGRDSLGDIRAQALSRIFIDGQVVYVGLDDDDYDDLLDDMGELGAPTGYLVNILTEDDATIYTALSTAAMIVIPEHDNMEVMRSALKGAAADGIRAAYEQRAVILAEGRSAALFGSRLLSDSDEVVDGLGWVSETLIVPAIVSVAQSRAARDLLATHLVNVAVGLGVGSALVLGPDGLIETWGPHVTIALGSHV